MKPISNAPNVSRHNPIRATSTIDFGRTLNRVATVFTGKNPFEKSGKAQMVSELDQPIPHSLNQQGGR